VDKKVGTKISDGLFYDERSAGGIVYRIEEGTTKWLVIKTATSKRTGAKGGYRNEAIYKLPKGHLKKGEFLKAAAVREVEEEGKIKAKVITKIGSNNYNIVDKATRKKIIKKVTFFLMEYTEDSRLRYFDAEVVLERAWLPFEEATAKLAYDSEKVLLRKAKERLESTLKTK
jgi:8-oxo-dGTP pyrophosphatase MutT (NUDIX family)